jgi:phosphohistidine phosphatase SixA
MKYHKLLFLLFLIIFFPEKLFSANEVIERLKEGGKIVMIRHSYAPGMGDPKNFLINDCSTQRNLDKKGIIQSKLIRKFFKVNQIPVDKVLSSEWCRSKDTAKYAFENFETFDALNSFYDVRFAENETKQINDLKKYIKKWDSNKNLIFVTHYVVILEILNIRASSGEIIIFNKDYEVLARVKNRLFQ